MDKTISDVAKELNVSISTVSKVINNRPGVGADLRKRITNYLNEIEFRPNALAQGMIKGYTNIVGLVLGDVRNPFYADMMYQIQQILEPLGYLVMTFNSSYSFEKERSFLEKAIQLRYAGLFLISTQNSDAMLRIVDSVRSANIPVVLLNRSLLGYEGSFVSVDNFQAGYMATKHLLELGHQRLAFLSGGIDSSPTTLRYKGFRQALETYNLPFDEENFFFDGDLKMDSGREAAARFLQMENRPTALVSCNDMMSLGFMDYCLSHQVRIPEDISIVSFDNIPFSNLCGIHLTTIDQGMEQMCRRAVEMMLYQIEHRESEMVFREMIEPTLMIRDTTAPPPGNDAPLDLSSPACDKS